MVGVCMLAPAFHLPRCNKMLAYSRSTILAGLRTRSHSMLPTQLLACDSTRVVRHIGRLFTYGTTRVPSYPSLYSTAAILTAHRFAARGNKIVCKSIQRRRNQGSG
jgi:hypothetical protein